MKKRYNKFIAYLLMDFSTLVLLIPIGLVMMFTNFSDMGPELILGGVISMIPAFLLTLYIDAERRKANAWELGFAHGGSDSK